MAQRLDPDGDITTTNWATTPLWNKLNDGAAADDAGFITNNAGNGSRTDTAEVSLTNPGSTPANSNTTVTIRGALNTAGTLSTSISARLMQGATEKGVLLNLEASWPDATFVTVTFNTTTAITDFNDLRVKIIAVTPVGETIDQYNISWVKVDVSDAATSIPNRGYFKYQTIKRAAYY